MPQTDFEIRHEATEMDDRLLERSGATGFRLGTLVHEFGRVAGGEDPWLALGDFLDDWRRAEDDQRELMIATQIELGSSVEEQVRRWAALFVGIADWLCWQNEPQLAPPDWLYDDSFRLADPWFVEPGERMQIWQLVHSPTPLRMRNVFVDPSVVSRA